MTSGTAARASATTYLKTIGIVNNGDNGRGFANPVDLAISADGRIFVLNKCDPLVGAKATRVGICNLDDDYLGEFGDGIGDGDTQFNVPAAMAFDGKDMLHIADEGHHRITVFDSSGRFVRKWGSYGSGQGQLNGPSGVAFDSHDNAFVVSQHSHRIVKFANGGEYLLDWGGYGYGQRQFNLPWGVTVDREDAVYVADWRNDRIQKFSPDGEFLAVFGESGQGEGQFHRPADVAVDDQGTIYVADWGNERVQVLSPDGEWVQTLRGQATLSKWAEDFFVSNPDEMNERVKSDLVPELPSQFRDAYQISSQTEPYFWGPTSVNLDRQGALYVTETNRHRFQVYRRA